MTSDQVLAGVGLILALAVGSQVLASRLRIPIPAADIGVCLAFGSWSEARGSTVQLLLNVILLIVVGAAGLSTQRAVWRRIGARQIS